MAAAIDRAQHTIVIKTSVIGTGYIARQHLACLQSLAGVRVEAVCDLSAVMAEATAEQFDVQHWFTDHREMLASVEQPVHILHGRGDRLIPASEGAKLQEALPATTWSRLTITRLFGHAAQDPFPSILRALHEVPRFTRALTGMLGVTGRDAVNACGEAL